MRDNIVSIDPLKTLPVNFYGCFRTRCRREMQSFISDVEKSDDLFSLLLLHYIPILTTILSSTVPFYRYYYCLLLSVLAVGTHP
jgi:hypothetical protein